MQSEWSHFFDITKLKEGKQRLTIEANEDARANLARRFNIPSIQSLTADLALKNNKGGASINVTGKLNATLTLECVVTEQEITSTLTEPVEGWFAESHHIIPIMKARREKAIKDGQEIQMMDESEDPEEISNGQIDLGELVAQHLSLAIPPYPKAEGVEYEGAHLTAGKIEDPAFDNPFAKLAEWKDKLEQE